MTFDCALPQYDSRRVGHHSRSRTRRRTADVIVGVEAGNATAIWPAFIAASGIVLASAIGGPLVRLLARRRKADRERNDPFNQLWTEARDIRDWMRVELADRDRRLDIADDEINRLKTELNRSERALNEAGNERDRLALRVDELTRQLDQLREQIDV